LITDCPIPDLLDQLPANLSHLDLQFNRFNTSFYPSQKEEEKVMTIYPSLAEYDALFPIVQKEVGEKTLA
jgi:hypothetical protein